MHDTGVLLNIRYEEKARLVVGRRGGVSPVSVCPGKEQDALAAYDGTITTRGEISKSSSSLLAAAPWQSSCPENSA